MTGSRMRAAGLALACWALPAGAFADRIAAAETPPATSTPNATATPSAAGTPAVSPTPAAAAAPTAAAMPIVHTNATPAPAPIFAPGRPGGRPGDRAPQELDAYGAVAYALTHAPTLLAQRATLLGLDSTFTKARASEFPSTSAQLQNQIAKSANQQGQFAQFGISPASNFSQNTAQLQSTYTLYNGAQQLAAQQDRKQVLNAQYELQRQQEQMAITVTNAFYALAADRGVITLDENDLAYQQALLAIARAEERVGRVAGVDVLKAQVAVARSQSTLVGARAAAENDREALAVEMGAPAATIFDVPATLPEPPAPTTPLEQLQTIAKMNRPEISEARVALDASKLGDASVDSDLRPVITVNGSFGSQVSPTEFVLEQQEIDESNAAAIASFNAERMMFPNLDIPPPTLLPAVNRHTPGFWQFNILSTFQIPLYDYGQRAAAHHAARAQIESSLASLYNAYDSVEADVDSAQRNLTTAAEKLQLAKLSADLGTESARIAQLQYKNGLIGFTDVTQTQQTALSAQNDLVAARVQYVTALVKLRIALAPPNIAAAADLRGI
jgi:outer membrane protein TolC